MHPPPSPLPPPAGQIKWLELNHFLERLLECLRPIRLAPGASRHLYLDMSDIVMMSVRIPDLGMQTSR